MTTKETKLRIEPSLDDWLNTQAAITGIAKTKYIIQALETHRSANIHIHPQISPELSPVSPVDVSIYAEVAALKSRVAKLEQGIPKAIPSFEVGQVITGQHGKLYNLLNNSKEVHQQQNKLHYYLSNKLGIIFYQYGESKAGTVKYRVASCFPGERVVLDTEGKFLTTAFTGELGWFTESELAALTEPISLVEPTKDETPIEVVSTTLEKPASAVKLSSDEVEVEDVTEAHAAQHEPLEGVAITPQSGDSSATEVSLSRDQLVQRIAKTPNEAKAFSATLTNLGGAKMKPAAIVKWTSQHDPDGRAWMPTDATRITWVMQAVTNTP